MKPMQQHQAKQSQNPHPAPQQQQPGGSGDNTINNPIRDHEKIWSGVLEWIEKSKLYQPKQICKVACHVTANINDGEPEIKAENWPNRLIMQLMPKHLVAKIGGQYLKDSKIVFFRPSPCESIEALSKVMKSGFAGCVHFNASNTTEQQCEIKVLILFYTEVKERFLGFIPNNQIVFVDRLRKVIIQQQSINQQAAIGVNSEQQELVGSADNTINNPISDSEDLSYLEWIVNYFNSFFT